MIFPFSARMFRVLALLLVISFFCCDDVKAVSLPACQAVAPNQTVLSSVRTSTLSVTGGAPFGLIYAPKYPNYAFVSLTHSAGNSTLGVLDVSSFTPRLVRRVAIPPAIVKREGAFGLATTHDGKFVVVATGPGSTVVDVETAIKGDLTKAVVGTLNGTVGNQKPGTAAIEVAVSKDGYAFVSQEYGYGFGDVDVFKLKEEKNGTVTGAAVGYLTLGHAVVGTAFSPNEKLLYAVSESAVTGNQSAGLLSVIDVDTLKGNPSQAQISNTTAGCGPVRIIVSSDGKVVWVTARESNHLLAFNATKLISDPGNALLASVQVGNAPVGLIFAKNGTRILTADSSRFSNTTTSGLSVVDVKAALGGSDTAVLGRIPTGLFPREFAVNHNGSVILVADYTSLQIEAVDVASIP